MGSQLIVQLVQLLGQLFMQAFQLVTQLFDSGIQLLHDLNDLGGQLMAILHGDIQGHIQLIAGHQIIDDLIQVKVGLKLDSAVVNSLHHSFGILDLDTQVHNLVNQLFQGQHIVVELLNQSHQSGLVVDLNSSILDQFFDLLSIDALDIDGAVFQHLQQINNCSAFVGCAGGEAGAAHAQHQAQSHQQCGARTPNLVHNYLLFFFDAAGCCFRHIMFYTLRHCSSGANAAATS